MNHLWTPFWLTLAASAPALSSALAWGPHSHITRAAQEVLPDRARAESYFGQDWARLQDYCLMPDLRGSVREDFYPDDFLLWPESPAHTGHMMPEVQGTYAPFYNRVLRALRTESPQNAARWMGSLLHFVEDSGAPCHARATHGEMHKRLENWLDSSKISITGYQPKLLGKDGPSALEGLLRRMDGLVAFSSARASQIWEQVQALPERADQPAILECANESARACADVLHTLLTLGLDSPAAVSLSGQVNWPPGGPLPKHPAKVMLLGTPFSTLTDSSGAWQFRNLPAGPFQIAVERTGLALVSGENRAQTTLAPGDPPGNLVRNPEFRLSWNRPDVPDHWRALPSAKTPGWESDPVRLGPGAAWSLGVAAREALMLRVRWAKADGSACGESQFDCAPGPNEFDLAPPEGAGRAQLQVLTRSQLPAAASKVWLAPHWTVTQSGSGPFSGSDHRPIQAAIDAASQQGGGVIRTGPGVYRIEKSLILKETSQITLRGEAGTILRLPPLPYARMREATPAGALSVAVDRTEHFAPGMVLHFVAPGKIEPFTGKPRPYVLATLERTEPRRLVLREPLEFPLPLETRLFQEGAPNLIRVLGSCAGITLEQLTLDGGKEETDPPISGHVIGCGVLAEGRYNYEAGPLAPPLRGLTLRDCVIRQCYGRGVALYSVVDSTIQGCTIEHTVDEAIDFDHFSERCRAVDNTVRNCHIGVELNDANDCVVENNRFEGCHTGINLWRWCRQPGLNQRNRIAGNQFLDTVRSVIILKANTASNTVENNEIRGAGGIGILVEGAQQTVVNNRISGTANNALSITGEGHVVRDNQTGAAPAR